MTKINENTELKLYLKTIISIIVITAFFIVGANKVTAQAELLMPNDGFWYEFDTDDALLYDDGYQGNYANNGLGALTIYPLTPGGVITLSFLFMDIEENSVCSWDYLEVYHGENFDSLVGKYCGTNLPPVMTSTDPTGSFTLLWSTDGSVTRQGFVVQTKLAGFPLPIELISFDGEVLGGDIHPVVMIDWVVASQVNNDYYEVQRSVDVENWKTISTVTGAGNSNTQMSYSILDDNPLHGVSYYRLKQTDYDGQTESFNPISIIISSEEKIVDKVINFMGQEVNDNYKGMVLEIYRDGTYVKKKYE
jgi:hypothetical protein